VDPYTFAADTTLDAGQQIIVARNPSVFQLVYGPGFNLAPAGYSPRNLSNGGEQVTLLGPTGDVLQSVLFSDIAPWPTTPDGDGPSLEIVNPLGDSNEPANWRASAYVGGSPGATGVPGDYDGNGSVDAADQGRWRASFGLTVARGTGADGNRDGVVDAADYVVWRNAMSAPAANGTAVGTATAGKSSSALNVSAAVTNTAAADFVVPADAVDIALSALLPSRERIDRSRRVIKPPAATQASRDGELLLSTLRTGTARREIALDAAFDGRSQSTERPDSADVDAVFAELRAGAFPWG
jgi:hypothetical protein